MDELFIIQALQRGEEYAFRQLYEKHYVVLCRFANSFLQDAFWAESIVDEVFFHIWEIRETLTIDTSLRNYLIVAVRNSCLNYLKSEQRRNTINLTKIQETTTNTLIEYVDTNKTPLGLLLEKELENEIQKAINELPKETLTVFRMSRFDNKKNEEIATSLGISINTVKYHIKKALSFLRERLSKYLIIALIFDSPIKNLLQ